MKSASSSTLVNVPTSYMTLEVEVAQVTAAHVICEKSVYLLFILEH